VYIDVLEEENIKGLKELEGVLREVK